MRAAIVPGPPIIGRRNGSRAIACDGSRPAARRLWSDAGLGPADVDAVMAYDHFTPMVLLTLEDWGFCAPGESGPFVEGGRLRALHGQLPVNTHGGQLSEAFIHGFNNLRGRLDGARSGT